MVRSTLKKLYIELFKWRFYGEYFISDENENADVEEANDSLIFVQEYIDLDGPSDDESVDVKPSVDSIATIPPPIEAIKLEASAQEVNDSIPPPAVVDAMKLEASVQEENDIGNNTTEIIVKSEFRNPLAIPVPIDIKEEDSVENNGSGGNVDDAYFGDGSGTSTDFESPVDRTADLIRLYHGGKKPSVVKKLEF